MSGGLLLVVLAQVLQMLEMKTPNILDETI